MRRSFSKETTRCLFQTIGARNRQHRPEPRSPAHHHGPTQARWVETQAQLAEETFPPYQDPSLSPRERADPWRKARRRHRGPNIFKIAIRKPYYLPKEAPQPSKPETAEIKSDFDFVTLSKPELEQQLHKTANEADYLTVHAIVKALIEGHVEPPSTKLYTALLQANADPLNGSAQEVRELLTNMTEDGCPPNSAAYHAALEVRTLKHLQRAQL